MRLFAQLPRPLSVPIVIAQHMPRFFTESLAASLAEKSGVAVFEGRSGMILQKGAIYIAPGHRQMRVVLKGGAFSLAITDEPSKVYCKPSVDHLFLSVAQSAGEKSLGIVLTGLGSDGLEGATAIKAAQGLVFAQDEASSTVFSMPKAVIDAGLADKVCSLADLKAFLQLKFGGFNAPLR
ncbi:MAG: response regulator receiver modulated CheB methylesterase [Chlamydiales bacterium]|nr:response regulator receiver modulated CheB methylesterase [Chlamydiales bacterium]